MIDKSTAKFLRYIEKNHPSLADIQKKYGEVVAQDEIDHLHHLDTLHVNIYASFVSEDREEYLLSPKGRAVLEDYNQRNRERIWTRVLSIAAIVVSLAALIVSIVSLLLGQPAT